MANEKPYIGYNNSGIVNLDSNDTGVQMLDKLSRLQDERRIKPLDQYDNVIYSHRYLYDNYNLLIGDTYFMIPPEFIAVTSEATSQSLVTLRQENTTKIKSGYHKRTIMIDLVFNGMEQLNGYPVDGPEGTYYVDGLRQLLAQFKCTPFLPISNEMINGMYGIFTVALQAITIRTMPGYPNAMVANITLQEVNMFPYIQMPDASFKYMIDWDLFRYYYQSLLTEDHVYKKLKSLPANKEHNRFKISILDESVFTSVEATKYNMLQIISDQQVVKPDENGEYKTNYTLWVDSDVDNVVISSFQCNYANILTNIQLSDSGSPTVQFMGGMDTIYNINFETTDYTVVQSLEQCQLTNDIMTRGNRKLSSLGFVKLESELVEFTGSLFVMIESVMTNTVPGFPGLYNVQIQCVAYDIAQSKREELAGFLPFDCKKSGRCGEYVKAEYDANGNVTQEGGFVSDHNHEEETIDQSMDGLLVKVKQDAYAEWKIRTSMEVYPDLRLPTYDEVDDVITKIRSFREKCGLTQLPYSKYPKSPTCMLHGLDINNRASFGFENSSKSIIDISTIDDSVNQYDGFVDPDFYVFYPASYQSFMNQDSECYAYSPTARSSRTTTKTVTRNPIYGNGSSNSSLIEQFIALAKTFIGHSYVWGAEGEISDSKGLCFDCSGFVTYLLKKIGVMPNSQGRFVVSTIPGSDLFVEVPWNQMQRGDVLCNADLSHVVIYEGDNQIIHASNSAPYPKGGIKEGNLYFTGGRCLRPLAFINAEGDSGNSNASVNAGDTASQIWGILKSYGLSDIAASGILGNCQSESGVNPNNLQNTYEKSLGYSDNEYTKAVDNGSYTNFVYDSAGYGLFQFTYWSLKKQVLEEARSRGVSISDTKMQVDVMVSQIKSSGVFDKLNDATTVKEASTIFLTQYEKPKNQGASVQNERAANSQAFYDKFKGTGGTAPNNASNGGGNTLTMDEFESICRVIMAETQGESSNTEKAVAQVIYDRLTHSAKKFGGLSNILNDSNQFPAPYQGELNDTIEDNVRAVFCSNDKYWDDYQAWYFLTPDDNNATFKDRDTNYDRLGEVDMHVFWGKEGKGSDIQYTITSEKGAGDASNNGYSWTEEVQHDAITIKAVKKFGQPVYIKTEAIMYDNNWYPWSNTEGKIATDELNSTENTFNTAFCDEVQYSGTGRLVRAFPAYLFCILDDQYQWYDGRKLWTNYYTHRSVVDIAVHATNDMPTETATITVTNMYHNLDRIQGGLSSYKLKEDDGYNWFQQWWYSWSGSMLGFGPKLTDKLIKLHQVVYDQALLRAGARIHLRMGYGSDPLSLAPMINGHISDISLGDQITMVVTSDGSELIQHIVSSQESDTNNGFLGLFGLGESQESSNIIANTMCARQSWFTHLMGMTFEGSKFSIEHFGLYMNKTLMRTLGNAILNPLETFNDLVSDIWDGNQEQYDILKNVYKANYKRQGYIYTTALFGADGEQNVVFNKYNMTPWDVFQVCTQQVPEYILKPAYHQFDSRLYFGLPSWMEKYRYDYLNRQVYEECKTAAQVHFVDSMDGIIDNQVKVTSKFNSTNVKVMYTRGSDLVSTKVIHSDDTIDFAKQKTTILDTPITQDALGPDIIYEFLGYNIGEESARRTGISNLLYGWQQQYQGQLILMGHPGLKPHDFMIVNDTFANLYGLSLVREVVHSFNINTGFTTSVTPGMVGFSTDENSGMIETTQNYLMILNCFSSYTQLRKNLRNNYEKNMAAIADMELMRERLAVATHRQAVWNNHIIGTTIVGDIGTVIAIANVGKNIYSFTTNLYDMIKTGKAIDTFMDGYKALKGFRQVMQAGKGISTTLSAIKAGTIATGTAAGGVPGVVIAVLWIIVDILLNELFEWLSNKNVCVLLPMWWEGYPFVAGVTGGEKILLTQSNSTATEEQNRDDPSDPNGEFD